MRHTRRRAIRRPVGAGGEIITWGQNEGRDGRGTPPPSADARDSRSRSVLEGLATYDLRDVHRALHPRAEAFS